MTYEAIVRRHGIDRPATVTTEHAASSYGQPVVVIDGVAHGPADLRGAEIYIDQMGTEHAPRGLMSQIGYRLAPLGYEPDDRQDIGALYP